MSNDIRKDERDRVTVSFRKDVDEIRILWSWTSWHQIEPAAFGPKQDWYACCIMIHHFRVRIVEFWTKASAAGIFFWSKYFKLLHPKRIQWNYSTVSSQTESQCQWNFGKMQKCPNVMITSWTSVTKSGCLWRSRILVIGGFRNPEFFPDNKRGARSECKSRDPCSDGSAARDERSMPMS